MQTYNVFWGGDEELGAAGYVAEVFFNGLLEERREGFTSYEAAEFWASEYVVVL